ncbi:MAG: hypothetical protein GY865_17870, partial [candidate division Zixibacteria bacterium]|nr:hypothetical protein [candidate division Zixibacteria bacterium]
MGRHKRDLMTIIADRLAEIHQSYRQLKYNTLVPCNCSRCKHSQQPHFYKFKNLRKRLANQKYRVECEESYEMVNVLQLIDDIGLKEQSNAAEPKNVLKVYGNVGNLNYEPQEENVKQEKVINIGDGTTVSAPVVIAEDIQNSFNTLQQSDVEADLKQLLDQLLKAVTEVNKNVPAEQAEQAKTMVRDAETLISEATSSKPRR